MQYLTTIGLLAVYTLGKTFSVTSLKKAQKGNGSLFQQMTFICLYALVQGLLLLVLPPYQKLSFNPGQLLLPGLYATLYVVYMVLNITALRLGPTSLTQLILSFNPLFPVFAGVLFWGDSMTPVQWLGLVLFCGALVLFNAGSYTEADKKKAITVQWILTSIVALLFGGSATACTRRYCDLYTGGIKEYLLFYCALAFLWTLPFMLYGLIKRREQIVLDKTVLSFTGIAALSQDVSNIIFMFYVSAFDAAFYFPLISVLGVGSIMFASTVFLRERINRRAIAGVLVSVLALALLALK